MKSEKQQLLLGHNNICIVITIYITIDIIAVLCTNQESAIIVHYDYEMFFFSGSDPCVPSPCENGATCSSDGNSYSCSCRIGWMGKNCQGIFRDNSIAPSCELRRVLNDTNQIKESALHRGITNRLSSLICIFYSFTDTLRDTKRNSPGGESGI